MFITLLGLCMLKHTMLCMLKCMTMCMLCMCMVCMYDDVYVETQYVQHTNPIRVVYVEKFLKFCILFKSCALHETKYG